MSASRDLVFGVITSLVSCSMSARDIRWVVVVLSLCLSSVGMSVLADEAERMRISESFQKQIQPLLARSCGKCHGLNPTDNDLNLTGFTSAKSILSHPRTLSLIAERVSDGDMPPSDAPQLQQAERMQMLNWIGMALDVEAAARAGDPGPVTLRRLSNTEYDNAIRDLTGVDMLPTLARFPQDRDLYGNQPVRRVLGDDAAILARSSGEDSALPHHRAGIVSMAWRTTR